MVNTTPKDEFVKVDSPTFEAEHVEEELPTWKLLVSALPWIAIQALWGTIFAVTTPYMKMLGLSEFWASNIWIFGPITGFFAAPIVGTLSDGCTSKYGRRRPFIIVSVIILWVVSLLFASSEHVSSTDPTFAIIMFVFLDIAINLIQTPIRAIVSDICSTKQQATAQLMSTMFQGLGSLVAFAIMKPFEEPRQNVFEICLIILSILTVLVLIQAYICKEKQYRPSATAENQTVSEKYILPFINSFKAIRYMPKELVIIAFCQFFSWFALFTLWPVQSSWYAESVYQGVEKNAPAYEALNQISPDRQRYKDGSSAFTEAGLYNGAVQTVVAALLPFVLRCCRLKYVYSFTLLFGSVFMFLARFAVGNNGTFAAITIALLAVPVCGINSFPFALVGIMNKNKPDGASSNGVQMGILNIFICVPQLISTVIVSSLKKVSSENGYSWGFFMGGISFAIASVFAVFVYDQLRHRNLIRESLNSIASNKM